ncbi:MAG: DUF3134 domain-containing protein [Sphaerospermopsis sp. SIO1G2]|nr:DUF3134 domain-containing protein [Sphaerospermopsis sp. SIO1G1]NET74341.1 DUF3134 domain-containing protein [Sphaerospermopsis sp. SIO1G2]
MLNSPLTEYPRNRRATVIPARQDSSILDWLEGSGRLIPRNISESDISQPETEISDFLGAEDGIADIDYDDDNTSLDED